MKSGVKSLRDCSGTHANDLLKSQSIKYAVNQSPAYKSRTIQIACSIRPYPIGKMFGYVLLV